MTAHLLSIAEVAGRLGVATKTARAMCVRGDIPSFRVGHRFRVRQDELERWLEAQRVVAGGDRVEDFRVKEGWR